MKPKLDVVIASTRPGRIGPRVAEWFAGYARKHDQFDVRLVDLAEFDLPMYNESSHPGMQQYEHDHTKAWAASVKAADAREIGTPANNINPTPAMGKALNHAYPQREYKHTATR